MQKTYNFPKDKQEKLKLINECKELSYKFNLDELDCSKSFARVRTNKSYEEILEMINDRKFVHWYFGAKTDFIEHKNYIDVGLCVTDFDGVDYFIFLYLETKHLDDLIKKYNLKLL